MRLNVKKVKIVESISLISLLLLGFFFAGAMYSTSIEYFNFFKWATYFQMAMCTVFLISTLCIKSKRNNATIKVSH